jgi:hypothetical protein
MGRLPRVMGCHLGPHLKPGWTTAEAPTPVPRDRAGRLQEQVRPALLLHRRPASGTANAPAELTPGEQLDRAPSFVARWGTAMAPLLKLTGQGDYRSQRSRLPSMARPTPALAIADQGPPEPASIPSSRIRGDGSLGVGDVHRDDARRRRLSRISTRRGSRAPGRAARRAPRWCRPGEPLRHAPAIPLEAPVVNAVR